MIEESYKVIIERFEERYNRTYWMSIEKNECLDYEIAVFAIEVPKK